MRRENKGGKLDSLSNKTVSCLFVTYNVLTGLVNTVLARQWLLQKDNTNILGSCSLLVVNISCETSTNLFNPVFVYGSKSVFAWGLPEKTSLLI